MATLYILRGLPGAGKSTISRTLAAARVNRDAIRDMVDPTTARSGADFEKTVTSVQFATIGALLKTGVDVVSDDTNLSAGGVKKLAKIARAAGANVTVTVVPDGANVEVAITRDLGRPALADLGRRDGAAVGEDVIRNFARRYIRNGALADVDLSQLPAAAALDIPPTPEDAPTAYIFDIDGTLADMGERWPFAWSKVGEDSPIESVVAAAQALHTCGHEIIIMTGRDGICRDETVAWLNEHKVPYRMLLMKAPGDRRPDSITKPELYRNHVAGYYRVLAVLEDRDKVVDMWRGLNIPCWQVAPGSF